MASDTYKDLWHTLRSEGKTVMLACHVFEDGWILYAGLSPRPEGVRYTLAFIGFLLRGLSLEHAVELTAHRACCRKQGVGTKWLPALVYSNSGLSPQRHAYWSDYYQTHRRVADDVQPAPWVSVSK